MLRAGRNGEGELCCMQLREAWKSSATFSTQTRSWSLFISGEAYGKLSSLRKIGYEERDEEE
jgi:hypothetical protein